MSGEPNLFRFAPNWTPIRSRPSPTFGRDLARVRSAVVSPDGNWLALHVANGQGGGHVVWLSGHFQSRRGGDPRSRATAAEEPVWDAQRNREIYYTNGENMMRREVACGAQPIQLDRSGMTAVDLGREALFEAAPESRPCTTSTPDGDRFPVHHVRRHATRTPSRWRRSRGSGGRGRPQLVRRSFDERMGDRTERVFAILRSTKATHGRWCSRCQSGPRDCLRSVDVTVKAISEWTSEAIRRLVNESRGGEIGFAGLCALRGDSRFELATS